MRAADPSRKIVALSGDYDFQFMLEELAVGAQFKLPYLHIVVNNSYLGLIRQSQRGFGMDYCVQLAFDNINTPADEAVRRWAITASKSARRYGSICTGTFALAHFGLLQGKRVATHWSACGDLAERCPDVSVDTNALFVNDGRLWTSAGVTTGIDMSLEMVATDLGNAVAHVIAKRLVLYARRPGYQSQFSPVLNAQSHADAPFAELIHWMRENLALRLDVPLLAEKVAMSERTFLRKFTTSTGETPAHFVETLRLDQTRNLLAAGMSLKEIAARTGYSTGAQLSKAFDRRFGMTPLLFRELHCRTHHG